jgi:exopolyphosphatase/guanosine-5'-triphosphate,3'-diphosphate pyrophosphatase
MKLAALDLGSNSFHLLVADVNASGELSKVGSAKQVLRLGSVVQEHGQLSDVAFERAVKAVGELANRARELGAIKLLAVGTSALRDARNGATFCRVCAEHHGVQVELLSGGDEARLAYRGARSAINTRAARLLVADVGGGSVELAAGVDEDCDTATSLPLGFLRLSHAFPVAEPGGAQRLARYVQLEVEKARWQLGRLDTLLLSGGTARAIGKLLGGGVASANTLQVVKLCARLGELNPAELQSLGVDAARSSSLAAGAAVVAGILAGLNQRELRISPRGLREGLLLRELARRLSPTRAA